MKYILPILIIFLTAGFFFTHLPEAKADYDLEQLVADTVEPICGASGCSGGYFNQTWNNWNTSTTLSGFQTRVNLNQTSTIDKTAYALNIRYATNTSGDCHAGTGWAISQNVEDATAESVDSILSSTSSIRTVFFSISPVFDISSYVTSTGLLCVRVNHNSAIAPVGDNDNSVANAQCRIEQGGNRNCSSVSDIYYTFTTSSVSYLTWVLPQDDYTAYENTVSLSASYNLRSQDYSTSTALVFRFIQTEGSRVGDWWENVSASTIAAGTGSATGTITIPQGTYSAAVYFVDAARGRWLIDNVYNIEILADNADPSPTGHANLASSTNLGQEMEQRRQTLLRTINESSCSEGGSFAPWNSFWCGFRNATIWFFISGLGTETATDYMIGGFESWQNVFPFKIVFDTETALENALTNGSSTTATSSLSYKGTVLMSVTDGSMSAHFGSAFNTFLRDLQKWLFWLCFLLIIVGIVFKKA